MKDKINNSKKTELTADNQLKIAEALSIWKN